MDISQLKLEVLGQILKIEDKKLLNQINNLLSSRSKDFADDFSESELKEIETGLKELEEGRGIPAKKAVQGLRK